MALNSHPLPKMLVSEDAKRKSAYWYKNKVSSEKRIGLDARIWSEYKHDIKCKLEIHRHRIDESTEWRR